MPDEVNPSFEATVTEERGHRPDDMIDKNLTTFYRPGGANGSIIYHIEDTRLQAAVAEAVKALGDYDFAGKEVPASVMDQLFSVEEKLLTVYPNIKVEVISPDGKADVLGAALSAPPVADKDIRVIVRVKKSQAPESLPSDIDGARLVALDITMDLISDTVTTGIQPKTPISITMVIPEGIRKNNIVIYHYHEDEPDLIIPSVKGSRMSFTVTQLSLFVIANKSGANDNNSNDLPSGSGSGGKSHGPRPVGGQWKQDQKGWRFLTYSGNWLRSQWSYIRGKWYYFNQDGYMMTGWVLDNGKWYYLNPSGDMKEAEWVLYKDQWYYMKEDGSMAVNEKTPDGNLVDGNGVWVQGTR